MFTRRTLWIILSLSMVIVAALFAETKTWTGNVGDNEFYNGSNWDPPGVPTGIDDLVIPHGTPEVQFKKAWDTTGAVNCASMTISGTVRVPPRFRQFFGSKECKLMDGALLIIESPKDFCIVTPRLNVVNSEIIASAALRMVVGQLYNEAGTIEAKTGIKVSGGSVMNLGTIRCASEPLPQKGGSVEMNCRSVWNYGQIMGGDGVKGGDLLVTTIPNYDGVGGFIVNERRSALFPSMVMKCGEGSQEGGRRVLKGNVISEKGKNYTPKGAGKTAKAQNQLLIGEDVMIADSIALDGAEIWASKAQYLGRTISIQNIHAFGIEAVRDIDFYTLPGGGIDGSVQNEQDAVTSDSGEIHVYSSNLIGPAQGSAWLFDPDPVVHAPDTTIIDGAIACETVVRDTNRTGWSYAYLQNFGTGVQSFQMTIHSRKGWLTAVSDTIILPALKSRFIHFQYSIPPNAKTMETDTVIATISADPDFTYSDTTFIFCKNGVENTTGVDGFENTSQPGYFELRQNHPNPFNPNTSIEFGVPTKSRVILKIFDIQGREVRTLVDRDYSQGRYRVSFNAEGLPAGIYLYRIQMRDFQAVKKMMVVK